MMPAIEKLTLSPIGELLVVRPEGDTTPVRARPCFPLSEPERVFSLLDEEGNELQLVDNPADLDPLSREALGKALSDAAFTIVVTGIHSITTDIDLRLWKVRTAAGPRTFQTRLGSWPRKLDTGGVLIQDVAEDLYHIPDVDKLDRDSRRLLWAYSD